MERQLAADVVVVGAGVVGASIALELTRRGRRVLVVDKGEAVGGGSTSASSSIVRFTYSTRDGVVAAWESLQRWRDWRTHVAEAAGPLSRMHQVGMLHLPGPDDDLDPILTHFDTVDIPYELLDAPAIQRRFPALDTGSYHPPKRPNDEAFYGEAHGVVRGLWTPDAGFIDDPALAATNLMDAAKTLGAEVLLRAEVVAILCADGRVTGVALGGGREVSAPVVINAAGPWSAGVNALAGVVAEMNITTRALRQEVSSTSAPTTFGVDTGGAVVGDLDLGCYFRPQPGGSFIVGGVEAPCDPLVWVDNPEALPPHPSPDEFEASILRAARRLPDLEVPRQPRGLADNYDVTDDWIPVYDRTSLGGYYLAIGTSGNQFKNAPLVGELMAELITACEHGHDHDTNPVTFMCGYTGLELDIGHYSRLRRPRATSGTVMG